MIFHEKYEFADLVEEDDNAKLYLATEISTGRRVSVFLFEGDQARMHSDLIEQLRTADRSLFPELIEIGSEQGHYYLVTQPLAGLCGLKALASRLKAPAGSTKTGEFTKVAMFRVPKTLVPPSGQPEKAARPSEAAAQSVSSKSLQAPSPPPSPSTAQQESGEFTRLFQVPAAPIGESPDFQPQASGQPPAFPPSPEREPGEFTRFFEAPAVPIGEPSSAVRPGVAPPVQTAPGEFTRFFQSAPVSPEPAPVESGGAQGQFTRIFGSGTPEMRPGNLSSMLDSPISSGAPADKTPPSFNAPAGEFTRIFGGASAETPSPAQEAPVPAAPEVRQASAAPGEYTRIFNAQPAAPEPVADQPAEQAVPAAPGSQVQSQKHSRLPLILGGLILLLLIIIAILAVTIRK